LTERLLFLDEDGTGLKKASQKTYESLWIKPLEQVQGDERDVILLSTGFSAIKQGTESPAGKISHLGPLDKVGAERRLNVALTRAREQLVVVTSMHSNDISDNFKNLGPKYLTEFLRFLEVESQKGTASHKPYVPPGKSILDSLSPMVRNITEQLLARGYQVENNVGYSSYKIEIAVKDPDNPSRYLLAIETDGLTYQTTATSRDRDILRPSILKVFGWGDVYRVWLLEYMKSPKEELERIVSAIEAARSRPVREPLFTNKNVPENSEDLQDIETDDASIADFSQPDEPPTQSLVFRPYTAYNERFEIDAGLFGDEARRNELCERIYPIIQHESPILFDVLKKRITSLSGFNWGAKRIESFKAILGSLQFKTRMRYDEENQTIWDARTVDTSNFMPRQACQGRNMSQTPPEEIRIGTHLVLNNIVAADPDTIIAETCKAFNVRATKDNRETIIKAIEELKRKNQCYDDNGIIRIA